MEKNKMKDFVERATSQLAEFYDGNSWVTDNFTKKVLSINQADALKKVAGHNHSIAQLVGHMIAWRNFVLQKLTGNHGYDIEDDSATDWPDPLDWDIVRDEFKTVQLDLVKAMENFPESDWDSPVPGRNYSYVYLIHGIIQHDYYHYGQAGSILAALKKT